jgi:Phosphoenolpyruvate-protein kinase (PTS system EI component in bacteria)
MSFTLHGLAVSGGIAIGYAHLISHAALEVKQYQIRERDVPGELERLHQALATATAELEALREEANNAGSPGELSAFIDLHAMLLADPDLTASVDALIRDNRCNAEWAMVQQMQVIAGQFDAFEDAYLRERKHDVSQVGERVLRVLQNKPRKITSRKTSPKVS